MKKTIEYEKLLNIPDVFELYYAIAAGYKIKENEQAPNRKENSVNYIK